MNAIFNPDVYELLYGKIETFDPALNSRKRARKRAQEYDNNQIRIRQKHHNHQYKQKLLYQKKLGIACILMGIVTIGIGLIEPDVLITTVPFLLGGIGLVKTRKIVT